MLFVDGENFTKLGQEALKAEGMSLRTGPAWKRDIFLWLPGRTARQAFFAPAGLEGGNDAPPAVRSYLYTSMPTGEPGWTETRLALRGLGFEPKLFPRRQGRSKAVDIALTTDVLTLGVNQRYEVAVLLAGDGDYVPLVEAVKNLGLYVVVGFFSGSGLSPNLRIAADEYVDVTGTFKSIWTAHLKTAPTKPPTSTPVLGDAGGGVAEPAAEDAISPSADPG